MNYKYTYRFLLECKESFDKYLFKIAYDMAASRNKAIAGTKEEVADLLRFTSEIMINFSMLLKKIKDEKIVIFEHDILKWKSQGYKDELSEYKSSVKLRFYIPKEQSDALKELYNQFKGSDMNQTIRKMVEYMHEKDLFYKVDYV